MKAELIKTRTIQWLLQGNLNFEDDGVIATEVLFSKNLRKADLMVLTKDLHTLEIKGDFDNTRKLRHQMQDYNKTFDKVSVVTTTKHLLKIKKILPPHTGIILFDKERFEIIRPAKKNKNLNKRSLLMFLSKGALLKLYRGKDAHKLSTDQLRIRIANQLSLKKINSSVKAFLKNRYQTLFRLLLKDTGGKIMWDELRGLSGAINKLYG